MRVSVTFVDRLVDGREFRVTLEDSRKTAIAILAILESAEKVFRQNRILRLNRE